MTRSARPLVVLLSAVLVFMAAGGTAVAYGPKVGNNTSPQSPLAFTTPTLTSNTSVVSAGGRLVLSWTGFAPSELVTNEAHSTPVALPKIRTSSSGTDTETITVPLSLGAGAHEIVATGQTSHRVATFNFTVAGTPTVPVKPTKSSSSGDDVVVICCVAAGVVLLGGLLILGVRKRRHREAVSTDA